MTDQSADATERQGTLEDIWRTSAKSSHKYLHYFPIYEKLFEKYRGKSITFVEIGVQDGGSLEMWQSYFGPDARIVGLDLNPATAEKNPDFDIYIADQGDRVALRSVLDQIGSIDILLDDGGHMAFQQISTVQAALEHADRSSLIVVEDTHTNLRLKFRLFHPRRSFLQYADRVAVTLTQRSLGRPADLFDKISSVEFFNGVVAFHVDPRSSQFDRVPSVRNDALADDHEQDFRYQATTSAVVDWPTRRGVRQVRVRSIPAFLTSSATVKAAVRWVRRTG